jgi:hypothetical protein
MAPDTVVAAPPVVEPADVSNRTRAKIKMGFVEGRRNIALTDTPSLPVLIATLDVMISLLQKTPFSLRYGVSIVPS